MKPAPTFGEYKRRAILPLAGVILALYYLLVFQPLSRKAAELDTPVKTAWAKLAASLGRTNSTALDFGYINTQLDETRQSLGTLAGAERTVTQRLEPGETLRGRMSEPFRLVDYQNELSRHLDEMAQQARLRQVTIEPPVYEGFPQHRIDIAEPHLLWAALRMTEDLINSALQCGVTRMHWLEVPVTFTNAPGAEPLARWAEVPIVLEFTGSSTTVAKVLQSMPLRAGELKPQGLPEVSEEKGPLYVDRLLIKRQSPEKADEVRVWLKAVGFVLRE